jgi:hypothetical protein
MIVKDILRVIYSPVKAFESIAKKPDIKGPFIILALILVSAAIEQCAFASKIFLATRIPENDEWTESISFWNSNGILSLDNATYMFGNYSVRSMVSDATSIWMNITNIGQLSCSGDEGYKRLSFWMNCTQQSGTLPSNFTLRLFSTSGSRYFELDLTNLISKSVGNWSIPILGVAVGPDSQENWVPKGNSQSWENITGLEFMLKWSTRANLTMNIDDLYFANKPFSFLTKSFGDYVVFALINKTIGFFLTWIVYVGAFLVISGVFHQKKGSWRAAFIVIGYAFAIAIAGVLVRAILYLSLPVLNLPVSSLPPLTIDDFYRVYMLEEYFWVPNILYQLIPLVYIGLDLWLVTIYAVSIHALGEISWKKAAMFAVFAYLIKFFLFARFGSMI